MEQGLWTDPVVTRHALVMALRVVGTLALGLLVLTSACTRGASPESRGSSAALLTTSTASARELVTGCGSEVPPLGSGGDFPELHGSDGSVSLYGQVQSDYPLHVNEEAKIVWRVTGVGSLQLLARGPQAQTISPSWGPEPHYASNWSRPGDEWGSGFALASAGCWTISATRGPDVATVHVRVVA